MKEKQQKCLDEYIIIDVKGRILTHGPELIELYQKIDLSREPVKIITPTRKYTKKQSKKRQLGWHMIVHHEE